jgi:hypothetical protein
VRRVCDACVRVGVRGACTWCVRVCVCVRVTAIVC